MNIHAVSYYLSRVLRLIAALMAISLGVSLYYGERATVRGFLLTMAGALVVSLLIDLGRRLAFKKRGRERGVQTSDGFLVAAVCWLCVSVCGAFPYYLSGAIPLFINSLFESVSGFTTTGATILVDIEALPMGLSFWRCFTHWIGGMGVLVFLMAAARGEHSVNVMRAESTGPTPGKLVPKLRQSSIILYAIYFSLTLIQVIFLLCGGMPLFDSLCASMSTAGTGGFFIKNASIAFYDNLYFEVVITVFMVLFGVSFNVIYFLIIRNWKAVWKNEEFRTYLGIFGVSSLLIALNLWLQGGYGAMGGALRAASFQVGSIMTTTGFATDNFDLWPAFSKALLFLLMLIGASAGSTGGGIKVSRVIILCKEARRLFIRVAYPRSVGIVKLDGKAVDKTVVHAVTNYLVIFWLITLASILLVSLDNFDMITTTSAVLTNISNAGPGLELCGPIGNYAAFSVPSKLVLSMNMLIGRLEIYPILLLFSARTWRGMA